MLLVRVGLLISFFAVTACDPFHMGFKKNPAFIMEEAFKAVTNLDVKSFLEISGKEALCVYGNQQGLSYLKSSVSLDVTKVDFKHQKLDEKHFKSPEYSGGFWVYYTERYLIDVLEAQKGPVTVQLMVDCNYGVDGRKENSQSEVTSKKDFPMKECRLVKIIPRSFAEPAFPDRCSTLKIML